MKNSPQVSSAAKQIGFARLSPLQVLMLLLFFIAIIFYQLLPHKFKAPWTFLKSYTPAASLNIQTTSGVPYPFIFVSRTPRTFGSVYWDVPLDMPGVGTHSRTRTSAPGKLQICDTSGVITTLIDGSIPTSASMFLIDVNAPEVNYAGTEIVFAGLPQAPLGQPYDTLPNADLGAWRIYKINVNGTGLTQLTFTDLTLNYTQLNQTVAWSKYDDFDPCFLPDGRIVFSTTRFPTIAQYSGVRASNLYVMEPNGNNMHRITSERNGADRPMVDPLTGRIVFSRWWRNFRFAIDDMSTVAGNLPGGYLKKDGLTSDRSNHNGGGDYLFRNAWHAASINPDGTDLKMFTGTYRTDPVNHMYGGAFTPQGDLIANFFPMFNMSEAAGFGGLRKYNRGASNYESLIGITDIYNGNYVNPVNPTSFGIYNSDYAAEPEVLPDGRILFSWCSNVMQDYGIYIMNANGSGKTLVHNITGKSELQAKLIYNKSAPPIIADAVSPSAMQLPPLANGPYDLDGTFIFNALNVYFNAPVDTEIISAPPVGSTNTIRFYIDHQRTSPGSFEELDWPVFLHEKQINPDGSVVDSFAPANVPLFEQIRTTTAMGYKVPFTGGPFQNGAAMVEGMNYSKPGAVATCVGCHAGHTMIDIPTIADDIKFSNVAPGANIKVSTTRDAQWNGYVIDRKVYKTDFYKVWMSSPGVTNNQWVQLNFLTPIKIRRVKLYNPRSGPSSNYQITTTKVVLYADTNATIAVDSVIYNQNLLETGSNIFFNDKVAQSVKVYIMNQTGVFDGMNVAALSEIEVFASGDVGGVTSINDLVTANWNVAAYPNPSNDYLNISYSIPEKTDFEILVMATDGRKHLVRQGDSTRINGIEKIDMKKFKPGIYFIQVKTKKFEKTLRVVKT